MNALDAPQVGVRTAVDGDMAGVVAAYDWLFAPPGSRPESWSPDAAGARLRAALSSERSTVLVAESVGDLVGFATAYLDIDSVRFGLRCWVEDLAVHPGHRSAGIGAALLGEAQRWAAEHGASHLELDSALTRTDAHRFYERHQPSARSMCFSWALPS